MGKSQRDKGARGEREVAEMFTQAGFSAKRSIGQTRHGSDAPDVSLQDIPHLWVEVKRGKSISIRAAMVQARSSCRSADWPIVVSREDRSPTLVTMHWDLFCMFLRHTVPEALKQPDLPGVVNDVVQEDGLFQED